MKKEVKNAMRLVDIPNGIYNINGFTLKPGMALYSSKNATFVACWPDDWAVHGWDITVPHSPKKEVIHMDDLQDWDMTWQQVMLIIDKQAFSKACKEADLIGLKEKLAVYDGELKLTEVVPGEKSRNGGQYGFYTHIEPTSHPGVFYTWMSSTCDCGRCGGCGEGEYIVLTEKQIEAMIMTSNEIEEAGSLY